MALCTIVEVLFDIDAGHEVQHAYPPGALTAEESSDVAFSAFPDSLSMELKGGSSVRDSSFCFRLPRRGSPLHSTHQAAPHAYLYGHAFCRQRQDERLRRGCEQKSLVLLSHLPLFAVLEPLARVVGPMALSYGPEVLRQVYEEVQRWPLLEWGCRMSLPLLDMDTLSVQLPMFTSLPGSVLPAAVGAALGLRLHPSTVAQPSSIASLTEGIGEAGKPLDAGRVAGQPAIGGQGSQQSNCSSSLVANGTTVGPAAALCAPAASPAQVAAALADELDGCDGLPLCLIPQAYGQQELEASPFGECDCFTPLRGVLPQLWGLWELLLLGEPLMVVAPTPGSCSATVMALLSLLAPFPYSLDYRPYFTIHDPAFSRLAAGTLPTPTNGLPLLLGITNMYFLKALPEWPNVLSTAHTATTLPPSSNKSDLDEATKGSNGSSSSSTLHPSQSAASLAGGGGGGGAATGGWQGGGSRFSSMLRRRPATPAVLLSEPLDHCWMAYKPLSRPDKQLLQQLVQPQPSDSSDKWRRLAAVNSDMLRRHFQDLTKALIMPLLPYFTPVLPPPQSSQASDPRVAPLEPPALPPLDVSAVLARLGGKDAPLPPLLLDRFGGQRGLLQFYERLLRSPNLVAFFHLRRLAAEEWQRQEWAAAAAAVRAPQAELMSVDAFFLLEQQLAQAQQQQQQQQAADGSSAENDTSALAAQLQQRLKLAFEQLPEDLQQAILQTPSHAAMLGDQQQ